MNMEKKHEHEHEHHHDHQDDPVHNLMEGALTLSKKWTYAFHTPISAAELEERITNGLHRVSSLLAVNGAVIGHVKALVQSGEDAVTFSVTRVDTVDRSILGNWTPQRPISACSLTVNILSLAHTEAVTYALLEQIFAQQ